ncbi:MAG: RIP metalloprotease RseP [Bacteroidota bacterium]
MEGIIMTAQLLLGLSILVGVHELGHLLAAKAFGMRVEKYSIGFPPKIWGRQFGETEYSIGAIPLGGFVKITGMIDESLDVKNLQAEPEPWEFRAKPAWQRLIVMMGGIIVNVVTGIFIFIMMTYTQGESYLSKEELNKHGIVAYELGEKIGLKTGDRIININGADYETFGDIVSMDLLLGTDVFYTVERDGQQLKISVPNDFVDDLSDSKGRRIFIGSIMKFEVGRVNPGSNAEKGGLIEGDRIISVDGQPVEFFHEFSDMLFERKGKEISLIVDRDGQNRTLNPTVDDEGMLGFRRVALLEESRRDFSFAESIPRGTEKAFGFLWLNVKAFGKIFSGDISPQKSISGPIGIAGMFGGTWDWLNFWNLVGLLSMVLAFMNFLPIPALDGGHVMFLTWEMITGRKPSDKFLENAQKVGMVIILGIMVFAIFNDVSKLFP